MQWGAISIGEFAEYNIIPEIAKVSNLACFTTNDDEKATRLKNCYPHASIVADKEALLSDPNIEAVYIGAPTQQHQTLTKQAINAGKHVLVEKPYAIEQNFSPLPELLIDGTRCAVGWMYRHHNRWRHILPRLQNRELGDIRQVDFYCSYVDEHTNLRKHDLTSGGGSFARMGCYGVHIAQKLLGPDCEILFARLWKSPWGTADLRSSVGLQFGNIPVFISCAMDMQSHQHIRITTQRCTIDLPQPINPSTIEKTEIIITEHTTKKSTVKCFEPNRQFREQALWFQQPKFEYQDRRLDFRDNPRLIADILGSAAWDSIKHPAEQ